MVTETNVRAAHDAQATIAEVTLSTMKIIAIGSRGTAFADLSAEQISAVKMNAKNSVFAKTKRSAAQLVARNAGKHQGALWADSRSYVEARQTGEFWLGELEKALALGLVKKAKIEAKRGKKTEVLTGYVRKDFDGAQALSRAHKFIAVESSLGRIEAVSIDKETGEGKARNDLFVRDIQKIEVL